MFVSRTIEGGERQRFCTKSESNMRHANDNKEKEPPWVAM